MKPDTFPDMASPVLGKNTPDPLRDHMQHVAESYERCMAFLGAKRAFSRGERTNVDLKLCPDTWWPDKPKLLLAAARRDERD